MNDEDFNRIRTILRQDMDQVVLALTGKQMSWSNRRVATKERRASERRGRIPAMMHDLNQYEHRQQGERRRKNRRK